MKVKNIIAGSVLTLILLVCTSVGFGGGPLAIFDPATRTPYAYGPLVGFPVPVFTDLDAVMGPLTNAETDALTAFGFGEWSAVPTSSFSAAIAGDFTARGLPDITSANAGLVVGAVNGPGIDVMYDHDGTIISAFFGAPPGVLGIAGPDFFFGGVPEIAESWAVLNGTAIDPADIPPTVPFPGATFAGVFTHEFGHAINLAHTQTNGAILYFGDEPAPTGCPAPFAGSPGASDAETMYPFLDPTAGSIGLEQATINVLDDIESLSDIYPGAGWPAGFASVSGKIFLPDGTTEITGINVIARNVAAPFLDATSALSGDFTQGLFGPDGLYTFNGLTPGADYVVYIDKIVAGGFSTPPAAPFPGIEEFFNGPSEDSDGAIDDPCDFVLLAGGPGVTTTADVIMNFIPGAVFLGDDDFAEVTLPFTFPFCGTGYTSVFVGSNGFLTFGAGDFDFSQSVSEFLAGPPRMAGLWTDLNPLAGGTITAEEVAGTFVITFDGIPQFPATGSNSFTFTLRSDGTHDVAYPSLTATDGLAGRTPGSGAADPGEIDLSVEPEPIGAGVQTVYEIFEAGDNDLSGETLEFGGCPGFLGPPAIDVSPTSLTFTIPLNDAAAETLAISNIAPPGFEPLSFTISDEELLLLANDGRTIPIRMNASRYGGQDNTLLTTLSRDRGVTRSVDGNTPNSAVAVACPWLSASPASGDIAAGAAQDVTVVASAIGLSVGTFNCKLTIASNDPVTPLVTIPVTLNVVAANSFCVNSSFETGDFTGWVTQDMASPFVPLMVAGAGLSPGFGLFTSSPTDGSFAALHGFDGNGPGTIRVAQDVSIPAGATTIEFDYRGGWDLATFGATLDRTFSVTIEPSGGGAPLQSDLILTAPAGDFTGDTGPLHGSVDVSAFAGSSVRISFDWDIPENFSGPAFFQLDRAFCSAADEGCDPLVCDGPALFPTGEDGILGEVISAFDGDSVSIDIRVKENASPIGAFGFKVLVNPSHLAFGSARAGDLTSNFIAINGQENVPGEITVGGFGTNAVPANSSGSLIRLRFLVTCQEGDASDILITNLTDDVVGLTVCCNRFECAVCQNDGDVNGNGVDTPGDALCAFEIFLSAQSLPADCDEPDFDCELIAANVNCDAQVTPGDALSIFQRFLDGLPPEHCFAQTLPLASAIDYQPLLSTSMQFESENVVSVSFSVEQAAGVDAFGLRLKYPGNVRFVGLRRSELTRDWTELDANTTAWGELIVGGFSDIPLADNSDGKLFDLIFSVKGQRVGISDFELVEQVDDLSDAVLMSAPQDEAPSLLPETFSLYQNYPNPFNPETKIRFDIPQLETGSIKVQLAIYNISGQLVRMLIDEERPSGSYEVVWDSENTHGAAVPSGMYFYKISAGDFKDTKKMVLLR